MDDYVEKLLQIGTDEFCWEWLEFDRYMAEYEECQVMEERLVFH